MTALFLKYRPKNFYDLVGQDSVCTTLKNALKKEKPAHAYLFTGSRGTGKTSAARIFAKALNCINLQEGDPCGECDMCRMADDGRLVDLIEIDAASNNSVEDIRDLIEKITFMPTIGKRKIYIIDEVHMLSKGAFNALLKTLEEPPDYAYFCLATTELHKVPETIVSRCQTFWFERFTTEQIVERINTIAEKEGISGGAEVFEAIAKKAEGGMRDAISLLDQMAVEMDHVLELKRVRQSLGMADEESLEKLFQSLVDRDATAGIEILQKISNRGIDMRSLGHDFLIFLRQKIHENLHNHETVLFLIRVMESTEKALARLKNSPVLILPMEMLVIELCNNGENSSLPFLSPIPLQKNISAEKTESNISEVSKPEAPKAPAPEPQKNLEPQQKITAEILPLIAEKASLDSTNKAAFSKASFVQENGKIIFYVDSEFNQKNLSNPTIFSSIKQAVSLFVSDINSIAFEKKETKESFATAETFSQMLNDEK